MEVVEAVVEKWQADAPPDAFSYSLAMNACAQMGDYQQAWKLLKRAEAAHGIVPTDWMWAALLKACARARRLDEALQVVAALQGRGVRLNSFMISTLMDAHARAGDWQGALRLLEAHKPDLLRRSREGGSVAERKTLTIAYTTAITALGRGRQWRRALDMLYVDMPRDGVSPDVVVYGSLMHACGRARQWAEVVALFRHLKDQAKLSPNLIVCNSALQAFYWSDAQHWREALSLLKEMEVGKYPKARPNEETYRVVFHVLGKFAGATEAQQLYDRLPSSIPSSAKLAAEVLLAYANADDGAGALVFLRHLRQAGPSPDGLCFSRAVLACGRAGMVEDARALLHEMQGRGMLGHSRSAGMVERLSKEEAWEEAATLFSAITETFASTPDVAPGPVALNTGLRVFCSVGDWEGVVCLLRQMASYGIQPTESNRAAALQAVGSAGQWPVATFLLEEAVLLQQRNVGTGGFAAWAQGVPDEVLTGFGPALYWGLQRGGYVSHGHKEDGKDWEVQVVDFHGLGSRQSVCAVLALLQEMEKVARVAEKEKKEMKARGGSGGSSSSSSSSSSRSSRGEPVKVTAVLEGAVETSRDETATARAEAAPDGTSSDAPSTASPSSTTPVRGLVMVVGRGKNSPTGASVLAPYLVRALANPSFFAPPLTARQIPNNPGRIVLAKQEVSRYIKAQLNGGGK